MYRLFTLKNVPIFHMVLNLSNKSSSIHNTATVVICFSLLCHIPTLFLIHGGNLKQTYMVESNPNILASYLKYLYVDFWYFTVSSPFSFFFFWIYQNFFFSDLTDFWEITMPSKYPSDYHFLKLFIEILYLFEYLLFFCVIQKLWFPTIS